MQNENNVLRDNATPSDAANAKAPLRGTVNPAREDPETNKHSKKDICCYFSCSKLT